MRDIKFRAWDKKKNDWFDDDEGSLYIELNGNINFGWNGEVMDDYTDRVILLQYTGMKDVRGVEIYEGDIVKTRKIFIKPRHTDFTEGEGKVIFSDISFYILQVDSREVILGNYNPHSENTVTQIEVIGNIYENPELLED
ncbi:YopX family protein [Aerococcus urinaeequi]|uniref:YopX family protein n=1 Tax=Aerococcus urinaeequi TaxID=51665 RepID=UPI003D6A9F58